MSKKKENCVILLLYQQDKQLEQGGKQKKKAIIKKEGYNTVSINVLGFEPSIISYEELFERALYESNLYCYVDSFFYEDSTIIINKIDSKFNRTIKDEYNISFELTSDERFMSMLNDFLVQYEEKRERLNQKVSKLVSSYSFELKTSKLATDIYLEYCKTGTVPPIYWDEIALRVADKCKNNKEEVSVEYDSDYSFKIFRHKNKTADVLHKISGASMVTTAVSSIAGLSLGTVIASQFGNDPFIGVITAAIVSTGTLSAITRFAGNKVAEVEATKKLDEISNLIERELKTKELLNGEILPKPRLTL